MKRTLLADLMGNRAVSLAIGGVAVAQVGLHFAGLPTWECPFQAALGIPCPGCGLTRATDLLLRGQVGESLRIHAFAPILLACVLLLLVTALLPAKARQRLVEVVRHFEQHTAFSALLLFGLMLYWGFRLFSVI